MDSIDWDVFGHCCYCHKDMTLRQVVDQKETIRFSSEYTEAEFLLNDGSKMNVALCKPCKDKLTEDDHPKIMDAVIRGWEQEIKGLDWTDENRKDYMDRYSQLEIVCNSESKPVDFLDNKMSVYKEKVKLVKMKLKEGVHGTYI